MSAIRTNAILALLLPAFLVMVPPSRAEDADRFRPYFRFHFGNVSGLWGTEDLWSFGLGANIDRYWGGELGLDSFDRDFKYNGQVYSEISALPLVPQVRLRQPFLDGRLVPYALAGAGVSFLQTNDVKVAATGHHIDVNGSAFTVTAGAGIEYFVSDNVALGVEGKYFWLLPVNGTVDGRRVRVNLSTPTFTWGLRAYVDENRPRPLADAGTTSPGRFYFGVRVGGAVLTDDRLVPGVTLQRESSFVQTGGVLAGWDFSRHWGVELAVDGLEYRFKLGGLGQVGEYGIASVIPQIRYRMPLAGGRLAPYLTAGMGAAYGEFNDKTPNGQGINVSAKGIYPACSMGAGLDYFLVRNISLMADAGWLYSWNHKIRVDNMTSGRGDLSTFMFRFGFKVYLFD